MGFNSAFKELKLLKKNPGIGRLNNLNDPSRPQCVKLCVHIPFEKVHVKIIFFIFAFEI